MAKSSTKDLTVGSPFLLVLGFSIPLLFGFAFQQLYSFVDTAIVGKVLGAEKLAAVGSTGALNFLILGLCNGLCAGMAIPLAQSFGAKDDTELRRNLANAIYVSAVVGVIIALFTGLFCPQMLRLMATDEAIMHDAVAYIRIIFYAIPVTVLYNMAGGILRAVGDSKTPVFFLAVASLINIALDLLFMISFHMGVGGAAWATVISQLISGIGCVVVIIKRFPILHLTEDDRQFRPVYARRLFFIGIPMGLQFSITAIGSVIMQWSVNGLGVDAVAAMTAAGKLNMFFNSVFDALSTTMATFAGQNIGARKAYRVRQGVRVSCIIGIVYSLLAAGVVFFFGRSLITLFLNPATDGEAIGMAHMALKYYSAFYILLMAVNVFRLTIQGMGYTNVAMIAGACEMVARIAAAVTLVPALGFMGASLGNPMAWIAADLFLVPCYFKLIKQMEKRLAVRS